eukprot:5608726-Amphidinium_carterae.2
MPVAPKPARLPKAPANESTSHSSLCHPLTTTRQNTVEESDSNTNQCIGAHHKHSATTSAAIGQPLCLLLLASPQPSKKKIVRSLRSQHSGIDLPVYQLIDQRFNPPWTLKFPQEITKCQPQWLR